MAGTEEVTARASPPASASMSPLSLPAPACSQINLMAAGWWQIEPCPLWLTQPGGFTWRNVVITALLLFFVASPALFLRALSVHNNVKR